MIQFDKRCEICGMPISGLQAFDIDGHIVCLTHFRMLLAAGLLLEGMDEEWHFVFVHEKDIDEFLEMLK